MNACSSHLQTAAPYLAAVVLLVENGDCELDRAGLDALDRCREYIARIDSALAAKEGE